MENSDIASLINSFVGYRDMLVPIQSDLHDFLNTYTALKEDVDKLSKSFSSDAKSKLNEIYQNLSAQAQKSEQLILKVDQFLQSSTKYTEQVNKLISTFESINGRMSAIDEIEKRAEEQIGKLDEIIEEKRRGYNLKELQRSIETYSASIEAANNYINKDVAENVVESTRMVQSIKDGNENIVKYLEDEKRNIGELAESYKNTSELLKKVVEQNGVNEEYIFDILDRWAESRRVKTKR